MARTSTNTLKNWILASRPRTLPAAAAPVILASALAYYEGVFRFGPAFMALLVALLLQIGANIANDLFDYQRGADTEHRLGPLRVTQSGLLSPAQVKSGMWVVFGAASLAGLYLAWVGGWVILLLGALSILAALTYTGGPWAYGYKGLGDVFVFVFFGLVAVGGTYYVQALHLSPLSIWLAIASGMLVTAILVVNNLRDIDTDRAAGKTTLAVRFGERFTRQEYALLLIFAYLIPLGLLLTRRLPVIFIIIFASLPEALHLIRLVNTQTGRALNPVLGGTGRLELIYSLLFALGVFLERLLF